MEASARRLVVASATTLTGRKNLKWLYQFLDVAGAVVADQLLKDKYAAVTYLRGAEVTSDALVAALRSAARSPGTKVVDLVLMVHGLKTSQVVLAAPGGAVDVAASDLGASIAAAVPAGKLRLCYSTACYGATHNDAWLAAGFRASIGARQTNANSATELPTLLSMWRDGHTVKDALARGEDPLTRIPADQLARFVGKFKDANSDKVLVGDGTITIDS